jgi:translation initiation factor 1
MPPIRRPTGLVYSTELGRTCPECREPLGRCRCAEERQRIIGDGNVRVGRETRGRNGKGVTLITGLPLAAADLAALATQLKKRCGTGGTVKDGTIEIQGDHRDALVAHLMTLGYKARRAGG